MKYQFIIFFSIVLLVQGLVNYYIALRGYQALELYPNVRPWFTAIMIFLTLSYIAGRMMERFYLSLFSDLLVWIGSFWMAAMLYFFLIVLVIDIIRLISNWLPLMPDLVLCNYLHSKFIVGVTAIVFVLLVITGGYINALHLRVSELNINISKPKSGKPLTVAVLSDIHLGTIIGKHRFGKMVSQINELKPDLVLFPGDIVDEDLEPVLRQDIGETLLEIRAPMGVFAVTGNHEYIGGVNPACDYLEKHHIRVLRDTTEFIDRRLYLAGREDRSARTFAGLTRKPLTEIMHGVDRTYPIILMDHQPLGLGDAVAAGVDLQLSGHTHDGQLWPFNYITDMIYEVSHGYLKKDSTQIYVSCGAGTWGPPVRIGNRPEILYIRLSFTEN